MFGFGKNNQKSVWEDFENEALPHLESLYRVARWTVGNDAEAEDLVQETLTQALSSFHRYERGTNCRAWLMKIMENLNYKRWRRLGQMKLVPDTEEKIAETIAFEPPTPQNLTDTEILIALEKIPAQFRQIVLMADVEEFAYREIAEVLNVPIGTVMSRLHRGRKLLRARLAVYAKNYGINDAEEASNY
jgi:RNA polymerase sigma-70 factor (ECF subfamily)